MFTSNHLQLSLIEDQVELTDSVFGLQSDEYTDNRQTYYLQRINDSVGIIVRQFFTDQIDCIFWPDSQMTLKL